MLVHVFNPRDQEEEAGGSLKIKTSLIYRVIYIQWLHRKTLIQTIKIKTKI